MLVDVDPKIFEQYFPIHPHPFNSAGFLDLNLSKVDRLLHLVEEEGKPEMGLVVGIKGNSLLSPFSAPFGGFHFKKENMYADKIDRFINALKAYVLSNEYDTIKISLPPDIYHQTLNAKCVSAFCRAGFKCETPEITSYVPLDKFEDRYRQKNSREYYRQALRNNLAFTCIADKEDRVEAFELIKDNRAKFGRPIYMSLNDIMETGSLWPVDFFKVTNSENDMLASAIFYRSHPEIVYAVFWGDNDLGRPLRAMDFLLFNLWSYYQKKGFKYIDLGISTEDGVPNAGLLRFKETHEAVSSLRFKFFLPK